MSHSSCETSVFDFSDYREYLRSYYDEKKKSSSGFSYRSFAMRAKLSSPNYLKLVIDGKRRVTDKNLNFFIRGLNLNKVEAEYFRFLVLYTDCSSGSEDKRAYLDQIIKMRERSKKAEQQVGTHDFLKHWYVCVVRELVLLPDFQDCPRWVSQKLASRISPKQAKEALQTLKKLKLIEKDSNGKYSTRDLLLTTGDECEQALLVRRLHYQFSSISTASILNTHPDDRETSGLTVAIHKNKLPAVKKLIREFRQNLNKALSSESGNTDVYHLNINLFPLTEQEKQK